MELGVEEIVAMEREGLVVLWGEVIGGAPPRRLCGAWPRRSDC